jgi:hypothetical protein
MSRFRLRGRWLDQIHDDPEMSAACFKACYEIARTVLVAWLHRALFPRLAAGRGVPRFRLSGAKSHRLLRLRLWQAQLATD